MQFLTGFIVGTHLGKIISKYLEQLFLKVGLISYPELEKINQLESIEEDLASIMENITSIKDTKTPTKSIIKSKVSSKKYISPAFNR